MPVRFSEHSKKKLRKRGISQELAIKVVKKSDKITDSFKGRKLRQMKVGDKIVEIVTITEGSKITVITGYYLD